MSTRTAEAVWQGGLKQGTGNVSLGSGVFQGAYSFGSRFESAPGTNPEELIAAAHAGCFSMALAAGLEQAGFKPQRIHTTARVTIDKVGDGFRITTSELTLEGSVPGIDDKTFLKHAQDAKANCPVSKALAGVKVTLTATLMK